VAEWQQATVGWANNNTSAIQGDTKMTRQQQTEAIRRLADAIVDSVKEAGEAGAPSGFVYAALNAHGITLDQYYSFIAVLVKVGRLRQEGDLLYASK
jgi:hypothetical protein